MSTSMTRFEIQLPLFADNSSQKAAVDTFITNMSTLCIVCQYNALTGTTRTPTGFVNILIGYITSSQQATALGYLNTLNTALTSNAVCIVNGVTLEP